MASLNLLVASDKSDMYIYSHWLDDHYLHFPVDPLLKKGVPRTNMLENTAFEN